jgi:hypothetical protein
MTSEERVKLSSIADAVTARFPGVYVAYEDFANLALDFSQDGILSLYVFNVPERLYDAVYQFIYNLIDRGRGTMNGRIAFSIWTPEQTQESFSDEIARLVASDGWAELVTPTTRDAYRVPEDGKRRGVKWKSVEPSPMTHCAASTGDRYDGKYSLAA